MNNKMNFVEAVEYKKKNPFDLVFCFFNGDKLFLFIDEASDHVTFRSDSMGICSPGLSQFEADYFVGHDESLMENYESLSIGQRQLFASNAGKFISSDFSRMNDYNRGAFLFNVFYEIYNFIEFGEKRKLCPACGSRKITQCSTILDFDVYSCDDCLARFDAAGNPIEEELKEREQKLREEADG